MDDVTIRPATSRATKAAPTDWFTGTVLQDALATPLGTSRTNATLVTFTPGARTNWHTHKTRQVLVATQGTGMIEVRGKPPRVMRAGDVAEVPPGLVHWHGVPPVKSLFFSFVACVRNLGAFTVYGLAWLFVFALGGIAMSLISGLLAAMGLASAPTVLGGTMVALALMLAAMCFTSIVFTFRDCFEPPDATQAPEAPAALAETASE